MKKHIRLFLVITACLVLAASLGALFHQHHGDENLLDCQICHLVYQSFFVAIAIFAAAIVLVVHRYAVVRSVSFLSFQPFSIFQNRAPPSTL